MINKEEEQKWQRMEKTEIDFKKCKNFFNYPEHLSRCTVTQ